MLEIILFIVAVVVLVSRFNLPYQISSAAAVFLLALVLPITGHISWQQAYQFIQWPVMGYLFGIVILCSSFEMSDDLGKISSFLMHQVRSNSIVLCVIVIFSAFLSALFLNDSVALVGTVILLSAFKDEQDLITPLAMALAFSLTLGSIMTPMGSPQNMYLALHAKRPNIIYEFADALWLPTLSSLVVVIVLISIVFRDVIRKKHVVREIHENRQKTGTRAFRLGTLVFLALLLTKMLVPVNQLPFELSWGLLGVTTGVVVFTLSTRKFDLLKNCHWNILLLFIGLFVLVGSLEGLTRMQSLLHPITQYLDSAPEVIFASIIGSLLISNVSWTLIAWPLMQHMHGQADLFFALVVGSGLAGNIFVMGAASNLIMMQVAEREGIKIFDWRVFSALGIPLSILSAWFYIYFL